ASGSMPAWLSSETRRGDPDASTNLGRPIMAPLSTLRRVFLFAGPFPAIPPQSSRRRSSLEAIGDTTLGQIVRCHLNENLVASEHADAILAHAAGGMGNDFMLIFELDAERGVRKQLRDDTGKFQEFFFCHPLPDNFTTAIGGPPPEGAETSGIA